MTKNIGVIDPTGEFLDVYGSTRIAAVRQIYGNAFADGIDGRRTLAEVALNLEPSLLERLVRDHRDGLPRSMPR